MAAVPIVMPIVSACLGALCACINPEVQEKLKSIKKSTKHLMEEAEEALRDLRDNCVLADEEKANSPGKRLTLQVQRWHNKVQLSTKENLINQTNDDYKNRCCLFGRCSLNCRANYKIRKKSSKLLEEIKKLRAEHDAFKEIIETQPPRAIREIPTSSTDVRDMIKLNLEKVHDYLKDDNVSMVGICGMGGVGKTTLLNEINNSLQGGDANMGFKHVIYLVVSKEHQFEKLQKEISKRLGLPSDSEKSDIFEYLRNKDFLLLLDDIWKRVDLPEALGIPLPHHQSQSLEDRGQRYKHKVIFTTRQDDVYAGMKADKKIKVECLDGEEAWHLFKQHANEEIINSNAYIEKLAREVMERCSGLPLALKVIGGAMSNKKKHEEWEDMLTSLRKVDIETMPDMEESLFNILKLSYDNLAGEPLQQCFLCCAQWPEDARIPVTELIEYWIGFGLIDDFGNIGEAFNKGYSFMGKLNEACLLELESDSNEDCVKLHDVIRDMALWIVSECGKKKRKWIVGANHDDLSQFLKWEMGNWKETELIFLGGYNNGCLLELLNDQNIDEQEHVSVTPTSPRYSNLKSLYLINADHGRSLNFFPHMPSLTYLNLAGSKIKSLPKEIRVLVNLRYLNISSTEIESLPPELEELKELKYFIWRYDSRFIEFTKFNGLSTIARLPKLQVLDVYGILWLEAEDLRLLIGKVKAITMQVYSVEILGLLKYLPTWNIKLSLRESMYMTMHILQFRDLSYKHGEGLMKLEVANCAFEELLINGSGVSLKHISLDQLLYLKQITWPEKVVPSQCFQRLESIFVWICFSLKSLSWVLHLPCLKKLTVMDSTMEELFDPADQTQQASSGLATFPSLQCLSIIGMGYLVSLSTCLLDFPVLSEFELAHCPKLKRLPFKSSIVNNKFKFVRVNKELWEGLEWEDTAIQSHLTKSLFLVEPFEDYFFSASEESEDRDMEVGEDLEGTEELGGQGSGSIDITGGMVAFERERGDGRSCGSESIDITGGTVASASERGGRRSRNGHWRRLKRDIRGSESIGIIAEGKG